MVQSQAKTVAAYLKELPPERREVVAAVRKMVLAHLPKGYLEAMAFGMIGYGVPLSRYPDTYNGQPLCYAAIAAQKHYYSLYLMTVYGESSEEQALRRAFERAGKKLDMGKCCVRFKRLADLEMEALGKAISAMPVDDFIAHYEASRAATGRGRKR